MGNVPISCCRSRSPRLGSDTRGNGASSQYSSSYDSRKLSTNKSLKVGHDDSGDLSSSMHQSSQSILQHISEREPDDSETDPSSNPLNRPIFVQRSSCSKVHQCKLANPSLHDSYSSNNSNQHNEQKSSLGSDDRYKASSCSTIYIDNSTISQPNLDQTIRCVSVAIYYHIKNRTSDEASEIFDETIHPLRMPAYPIELAVNNQQNNPQSPPKRKTSKTDELIILDNNVDQVTEPDQEVIYNFVKTLFKAAQLTSEYAITTLVYLERLMTYAEMDLTPKTWRRMFLGAILLSSKVWEDQAIWNVDYAQILEEISVDDINELEREFLELIQFNINVPSSVYAKYYFHLRTLAIQNGITSLEKLRPTSGRAKPDLI